LDKLLVQKPLTLKNIGKLVKNAIDSRGICCKEAVGLLKLSTSLHTRLAAETHLADRYVPLLTRRVFSFRNLRKSS
jgi:hypothetical protein